MGSTGRDHGVKAVNWWGATLPTTFVAISGTTWLGVFLDMTVPGRIAGVRFYITPTATHTCFGIIFDHNTSIIHRAFGVSGKNPILQGGWNQMWIRPWLRYDPATFLLGIGVVHNSGYNRTPNVLSGGWVTHGQVVMKNGWTSNAQDPTVASVSQNNHAMPLDVLFYPD